MNERILIVEDDPAISRLIDTNLMLSGYQTFCAMDGRQRAFSSGQSVVLYDGDTVIGGGIIE